jgi:L-serine deaminase
MADSMASHLIVDNYDDCAGLKDMGSRMSRPIGTFKTTLQGKNNILDHKMACSVQRNAPGCTGTMSTRTQVKEVLDMMSKAQQRGVRSVETARQNYIERHARYNRAQCNRRMEEVTTPATAS